MHINEIRKVLDISKRENRSVLTENETKEILSHLEIPFPEFYLANSVNEAIEYARKIGYPVVLKVVSPEIIHKSEANGVKLNLQNDEEVQDAYQSIIMNAKEYDLSARIIGVSVQKMMIMEGTEVIIGMNRDDVFGPVLLFGLGGIFVELLKDVSMRVLPLAEQDIETMFTEINASKILTGFRGSKPVKVDCLKEIIQKVADFSQKFTEVSEFELNPVLVQEAGHSIALDARIILRQPIVEEVMVN